MKMEKYMESELSDIFQVKLVAKNSVWIPGDPKSGCLCSVTSLSEETYEYSEPECQTVFLIKQYTSLIYFKEKIFCLIYLVFPFVGLQRILSGKK